MTIPDCSYYNGTEVKGARKFPLVTRREWNGLDNSVLQKFKITKNINS